MELLSRRSSNDRMSTLKRSRSFRASMKLMSKLRNHANLRLNVGFDLSPVPQRDENATKQRSKLPLVDEASTPAKDTESTPESSSNTDNKAPESRNKDSVSLNESESQKISKELRNKLCLTDKITRKGRKDLDTMTPKVAHIFRWKSNGGPLSISAREKNDAPCSLVEHVSYENPTFCLDSSLDSSVSSFLFEPDHPEQANNEAECNDEFSPDDTRSYRDTVTKLTVVVDSRRRASENETEEKRDDDEEPSIDAKPRNFACNRNNSRPMFTGAKARSLSVNDVILRDEEAASSLDLNSECGSNFYCQVDRGDDPAGTKEPKLSDKIRKTSVCSTKSCRIRTVDNIANFWTNARGGSFRSKVSVGRKKSMKGSRDHEPNGQDRVLVTTTSGSSRSYQLFNYFYAITRHFHRDLLDRFR